MKTKCLLMALYLSGATFLTTFAQEPIITEKQGNIMPASVIDLACPPGSVFSQTPDNENGQNQSGDSYLLDNVTNSPGIVGSLTWWMSHISSQIVPNPGEFDIFIYADNAGSPGALLVSYLSVIVEGIFTGELNFMNNEVYEFTFVFPNAITVPQNSWIGIKDYPTNNIYRWWQTADGDSKIYRSDGSNFSIWSEVYDLAFCLGALNLEIVINPVNGGTVTVEPPTGPYLVGSTVTLTATTNEDFEFLQWEWNPTSTTNPLVLTLADNTTVTATFSQLPIIPLSSWALLLGIIFIATFLIIRFRCLI